MGEQTLAYASATRGFKSGGFNISSPEPGRGYAPEWAWSYEAGLKRTLASGRGRLNLAAFQMDYTDLQVQAAIRPGILDISNAAAATIRGVELEGALPARTALRLGGHLAWLDARYDRTWPWARAGSRATSSGHFLSNAPEWTGRLWLEWADRGRTRGHLESTRGLAVAEHRLLHALQRSRSNGSVPMASWTRAWSSGPGPGRSASMART